MTGRPEIVTKLCLLLSVLFTMPGYPQDGEDEGCESISAESIQFLGAQFSLSPDQIARLKLLIQEGHLETPEDLDLVPGLASDARDALTGALCWGRPWKGEILLSGRQRNPGWQEEIRSVMVVGGSRFVSRARSVQGHRSFRGAVTQNRGSWRVDVGTLRARHGLGLLLVTPGAESRGSAPRTVAAANPWRPTVSLDPDIGVGGHLLFESSAVVGNIAAIKNSDGWWGTASAEKKCRWGNWGVTVIGPQDRALAVHAHGIAGQGHWSVEWAGTGRGAAQGAAWRMSRGAFRIRSSLIRIGEGYEVSSIRLYRQAPETQAVEFRGELRWQESPGGQLRLGVESRRGSWSRSDPWGSKRTRRELELHRRVAPGVRVVLLGVDTAKNQIEGSTERERRARGQISFQRRRWRGQLRWDETLTGRGESRRISLKWGRNGRFAWEARIHSIVETDIAPDSWVYRRRAGGLYGWDRLSQGTWVGGWFKIGRDRWISEVSVDAGPAGWDVTVAWKLGVGTS